jgi:hypothetical protein
VIRKLMGSSCDDADMRRRGGRSHPISGSSQD